MATTTHGVNSPQAVKRFSATLYVDQVRESYFGSRFEGAGQTPNTPIQVLTDLASEAGDTIRFDLSKQLRGRATYGDDRLDGKEEALRFAQDSLIINQVRFGASAGGRMSRKRVLHDLRQVARARMSEWWGRWNDELHSMTAAGARGVNEDFIEGLDYTGIPDTQVFQAPDAAHTLYGGVATSKASLASTDKMTLLLIDKLQTAAKTRGGGSTDESRIKPIRIDGGDHFVFLIHPFQEYDLRTNTSTGQWLDIQKAAAGAEGRKGPIFKGGVGMYNNAVIHVHETVIRFSDYGAGNNVDAARAIFMGRQALTKGYGSPGNDLRMKWHEEMKDHDNEVVMSSSCIKGVKATQFENKRFGMLVADTAAADPNG
jgi:N4-gp56 family major capsid protein